MNHTRFGARDFTAALCIILIWGTNFVAMKLALRGFTPFQLGALRYAFATLPLLLFIKPPKMHWKWLVSYGMLQGVGQFGLLFVALNVGMTAALASVLLQTQVFFTALFGFILLNEGMGRSLKVGLVLAALGLGCFALNYLLPDGAAVAASTPLGFVLCLAAASMWAGSNIVVRKAQRATAHFDVVAFMVWSSLVPILPYIALSALFDAPASRWEWLNAPLGSWSSAAYLGWIGTILGYTLWTGLLTRHPVNRVAPFSLGVPIVGLATGMIVLDEVVTRWQWSGIVLIVASLICVLFGDQLSRKIPALFRANA
ncbi:EamA family transporter [Actimicrobium sp. CCI2.3]|uniref:EamA family transporter n=1 Tax=Actimicrobium sp. CCI2.3 TaxID=3048616 RepID=UPI002AB41AD4|nr:EamA family transporter [Actimicrobium sp. CCI2.3]MDY7574713.1 EamA family transporter [Actimicrobium sp. CCI2.3]MEB0020326.1 EamA family transporter [Actimicrobium sp. CCI2.3]